MKLLVISSSSQSDPEVHKVNLLFQEGLEHFHLRKPKFSRKEMCNYIEQIPPKYHSRIMIHSHHNLAVKYNLKGIHLSRRHRKKKYKTWWRLRYFRFRRPELAVSISFHSLLSMLDDETNYTYVFLSPVFDSISKKGYAGAFSHDNLSASLKKTKHNVMALGGVKTEFVQTVKDLGFEGLAVLGAIWSNEKAPQDVLLELQDTIYATRKPVMKPQPDEDQVILN